MGLAGLGAAILSIKILTDASDAAKGMGAAATGVEKLQAKIGGLVGPAALVGGAMVGMGKSALAAASDHEQAMGGIDTVFGKSADSVKAWGDQAAKSAGLSSTEYATAAAKIGAQLKTAGVPMDQIADKTKAMIQQGADLSATYGGSAADAVDALSSAMRGESDPAERLGLGLSAAAVAAEMAAEGTSKLTGKAQTAAKAQATMNLIAKQGAASMGQFAAQSGTAAEAQQIAGASMKNLASTMGQALLPAATAVGQAMAGLAEFVQNNSQLFLVLAGIVAGFAGSILAVSAALKVYQMAQTLVSAATKAWAAVQWLLNAAMSANPIGLVIIAVVALVAAIVLLWTKSAAFRTFFINMWTQIQTVAAAVWKAIVGAATTALAAIRTAFQAVGTAIKSAFAAVGAAIKATLTGIQSAAVAVWSAIKTAAAAVWLAIKVAVQASLNAVKTAIQAVGTFAAAVWRGILSAARAVWSAITAAVRNMQSAILGIFAGIRSAVTAVWTSITTAATSAFSAISSFIQGYVRIWIGHIEGIVAGFKAVFDRVASVVTSALQPVTDAINNILNLWRSTVGIISDGIGKVAGWISGIVSKFKRIPTAPPAAPAPGLFGVSPTLSAAAMTGGAAAGSTRSAGPTIVIQGAVDPDRTARQIQGILAGRIRRTTGVSIGGLAATA